MSNDNSFDLKELVTRITSDTTPLPITLRGGQFFVLAMAVCACSRTPSLHDAVRNRLLDIGNKFVEAIGVRHPALIEIAENGRDGIEPTASQTTTLARELSKGFEMTAPLTIADHYWIVAGLQAMVKTGKLNPQNVPETVKMAFRFQVRLVEYYPELDAVLTQGWRMNGNMTDSYFDKGRHDAN